MLSLKHQKVLLWLDQMCFLSTQPWMDAQRKFNGISNNALKLFSQIKRSRHIGCISMSKIRRSCQRSRTSDISSVIQMTSRPTFLRVTRPEKMTSRESLDICTVSIKLLLKSLGGHCKCCECLKLHKLRYPNLYLFFLVIRH